MHIDKQNVCLNDMKNNQLKEMIQFITKNLRLLISAVLLQTAIMVYGQCAYCTSYENFMNNQWEELDTIYCKTHSKNHQLWWGGNDYKLTTDLESLDAVLKKESFIVKIGDSLFLNCRNLRYEKLSFGNGFTSVRRIGEHSVIFVHKMLENNQRYINPMSHVRAAGGSAVAAGVGVALGTVLASALVKEQNVCYVISSGADEKGRFSVRMVADGLMNEIIDSNEELYNEYYSEPKEKKRILASRVIPILEKTGIFDYVEQKQ